MSSTESDYGSGSDFEPIKHTHKREVKKPAWVFSSPARRVETQPIETVDPPYTDSDDSCDSDEDNQMLVVEHEDDHVQYPEAMKSDKIGSGLTLVDKMERLNGRNEPMTVEEHVEKALIGHKIEDSMESIKIACDPNSNQYKDGKHTFVYYYSIKQTPDGLATKCKGKKMRGGFHKRIIPFVQGIKKKTLRRMGVYRRLSECRKDDGFKIKRGFHQDLHKHGENLEFVIKNCKLVHLQNKFPFHITVSSPYLKNVGYWGSEPFSIVAPPSMYTPLVRKDLTETNLLVVPSGNLKKIQKIKFLKGVNKQHLDELLHPSKSDQKTLFFEYGTEIGGKMFDYILDNNVGGMTRAFSGKPNDKSMQRVNIQMDDAKYLGGCMFDTINDANTSACVDIPLHFRRVECGRGACRWNKPSRRYKMNEQYELVIGIEFELKLY